MSVLRTDPSGFHSTSPNNSEPSSPDSSSPSIALLSHTPPMPASSSTTSFSPNGSSSTPDDPALPAWKLEIQARRKSKCYSVPSKPEPALATEDMPQWKRELAERRKNRKEGDGSPLDSPAKVCIV